MSRCTCAVVRRRLAAWHDGELPIEDQIAIQSHLQGCSPCAVEAARLLAIGEAIRDGAARGRVDVSGDLAGLPGRVVSRLKAERDASVAARLGRMLEDGHLIWVGVGAVASAAACVVLVLGLLSFAADARSDSLAAMLAAMGEPGSNENPMRVDEWMRLPRVYPDDGLMSEAVMSYSGDQDTVVALATVVTREGRLSHLEVLLTTPGVRDRPLRSEARATQDVLHAASQARFVPARFGGAPVAVNMIWLLAHTTVRGKREDPLPIPRIAPRPSSPDAGGASAHPDATCACAQQLFA